MRPRGAVAEGAAPAGPAGARRGGERSCATARRRAPRIRAAATRRSSGRGGGVDRPQPPAFTVVPVGVLGEDRLPVGDVQLALLAPDRDPLPREPPLGVEVEALDAHVAPQRHHPLDLHVPERAPQGLRLDGGAAGPAQDRHRRAHPVPAVAVRPVGRRVEQLDGGGVRSWTSSRVVARANAASASRRSALNRASIRFRQGLPVSMCSTAMPSSDERDRVRRDARWPGARSRPPAPEQALARPPAGGRGQPSRTRLQPRPAGLHPGKRPMPCRAGAVRSRS
jgi:hypothetical protein